MRVRRRSLLLALAAISAGLSQCGPMPAAEVVGLIKDAEKIVDGVAAELGDLSAFIPADYMEMISQDIAKAQGALQELSTVTTQLSAVTPVQAIEGAIADILNIAGSYALPSAVMLVLDAAQVLLPVIASKAGLASAISPARTPTKITMTADEARIVLAVAAGM
jgi:hypothetical protein